ncbi:hypothetical protein ACHAWF_007689 [Thalassiosira exigua]
MAASAKRQRLDEAASKAATPLPEVGLPAELWAKILGFAHFDEVLCCAAANKFFLNDVTRRLEVLRVRSGESMEVDPAAARRFGNVTRVCIYLISELKNGIAEYHLDYAAMKNVVPFLSNLPKLKHCSLGRLRYRYDKSSHFGDHYDVDIEGKYDEPESNRKWAELIQSVCRAYKTGEISKHVSFEGLLPVMNVGPDCCMWRNKPIKIDSYRDDVPCQMCDMLVASFPPLQVLDMCPEMTPCIEFKNIAKIVRYREEGRSKSTMTKGIVKVLEYADCTQVMCPPDYVSRTGEAALFYDHHFEWIACLVENGADPKDSSIVEYLLSDRPQRQRCFVGRKLMIELGSYTKLKELGLDLNEDNFITVDESDKRTSICHFEDRKVKKQIESSVAISDIGGI